MTLSMILPDAREVALDEVERCLAEELGDVPLLRQRAENLIAIAVAFEVRIEDLKTWIRMRPVGKHWTAAEFKRLCERFAAARQLERSENDFDGDGPTIERLCPGCAMTFAGRTRDGRAWHCPTCGVFA